MTFYEEYFTDCSSAANIYEYSNKDYSKLKWDSFDIVHRNFLTGKIEALYLYKPRWSTTTSIGFEIKFDKDVEYVLIESFIAKYLTIYTIVFIFIIICIAIFIAIYCCCHKKSNTNNVQIPANQILFPVVQNQPSSQYNQYTNNTQYNNNQYKYLFFIKILIQFI